MGVGPVVKINAPRALRGGFLRADTRLVGEFGMVLVGAAVGDIIIAHDIDDRRYPVSPAAADGNGNSAGRVQPLGKRLHLRSNPCPHDIAFNGPFLVAQRPEDDTGVIPVTQNHGLELFLNLRRGSHQAVFVDDQHAQPVAGVQQFRGRRIMRTAVGIGAHVFKTGNAEFLQSIRNSRADAGVVLVIVGAFELDGFAVQKEALIRVKMNGANAEWGFNPVNRFSITLNEGDKLIEIGGFERPELWGVHG